MKKRVVMMAGILCLAICGCGKAAGENEGSGAGSVFESTENGAEKETAGTENAENEAGSGSEFTDEKPIPVYSIAKKHFYNYYDGDLGRDEYGNYTCLFKGFNEVLVMDEAYKDYYPEMYQALESSADANMSSTEKYATETTQLATEDFENAMKEGYDFYGPYESSTSIYVTRSDEKVLSYYSNDYSFEGGVHGMYGIGGTTYDVQTGKEIALTDVVKVSEEELNKVVMDKLNESAEDPDQFFDLEESLSHYKFSPKENDPDDYENYEYGYNWYLSQDGLHIVFNPYEIAAYAYGLSDVVIGYDEFAGMIDERFAVSQGKGYVVPADTYIANGRYDEENNEMHLRYTPEFDEEEESSIYTYDYANSLSLIKDGKEASIEEWFEADTQNIKYYDVMTKEGKEYLYVSIPGMDDYCSLLVYDITGDNVSAAGTFYYHSYNVEYKSDYYLNPAYTDPENMRFGQVKDSFGTFTCYADYAAGADGIPVERSDCFTVASWYSDDSHSSKDVTVDVVDENGNVVEEGVTIPAGQHFNPLRTDGESWIDCSLEDGRTVRLKFTSFEYPATIDGTEVDELFSDLVYVG